MPRSERVGPAEIDPVVLRGIARTTGGYVVVGDPPDQAIGDGPLLARIDV